MPCLDICSSGQVPAEMCSLTQFFGVCRQDTHKHGARGHGGWHNLPRWRHILGLVSCLFVFDVRCCSMLQRVTARIVVVAVVCVVCCFFVVMHLRAFCRPVSSLQCVAVRCRTLQYVAVCCSVLVQFVAMYTTHCNHYSTRCGLPLFNPPI